MRLPTEAPTEPAIAAPATAAPSPAAQPALPVIEPNPTPIDARDIIVSARFTKRVDPEYPPFAADAGIEGTVIVLVTVAPDGSASDFRVWVSSGSPALDHAALVAAERSTYAPPQVEGLPAYETYRIIESFEKL
jgi:protein TonB